MISFRHNPKVFRVVVGWVAVDVVDHFTSVDIPAEMVTLVKMEAP